MKLTEIPKEELDLMGYDEVALLVLQENGKKMKLRDIFVKVCEVLGKSEDTVDNELVDFFEMLSINKKFTMLDKGYWDLQTRHDLDLSFLNEEEEEEEVVEPEEEEIVEEDTLDGEDDLFYDDEADDDPTEDDLKDLAVIDDTLDETDL